MTFTRSWLKDHLETEATLDEIVETLTMIGLEVEEVDDLGVKAVPASTLSVREVLLLVVAQRHRVDRVRCPCTFQ